MRTMLRNKKNRRGATVVEFALVAPVFFLSLFACIDFARFWMAEAIVENTAFQTARNVSVFGATSAEAEEYARAELAILAIGDFNLEITPFIDGNIQTGEITDETTEIQLELSIPAAELSMFSRFFSSAPLVRTTSKQTNRPN